MAPVSQELSTTSYALLGLLAFDAATSRDGMTGYELKQRADVTLRFYWTSPAMSQIYSELGRLARAGYVEPIASRRGRRTTRRYRISASGSTRLTGWLATSEPDFPVLKHPVALRLLMGHLMERDDLVGMLDAYRDKLDRRRGELEAVLAGLDESDERRYPALVARWGLAYYDSEREIVERTLRRLPEARGDVDQREIT